MGHFRWVPGLGLALAFVACAAAGTAAALVASCVPDLPADGPAAAEAGAQGDGGGACGDGIIDLAAGEECDPGREPTGDGGVCSANCKVICAGLKWPPNDHCYELQPAEKDLDTTAVSVCDSLNVSHIATFSSSSELSAAVVYASANILAANDFWVGLVQGMNQGTSSYSSVVTVEPGWAPDCPGCFADTLDPDLPLHLPKNAEAGAGCVMATFAGTPPKALPWNQYPCDGTAAIHVLCEREPVGTRGQPCSNDPTLTCLDLVFTAGAKHYVYVGSGLPADQAATFCAGQGGTLVVFESRDEREQLWHELPNLLGQVSSGIWIGLATDDAGLWTWDDGTRVDAGYPPPWAIGQPASPTGRAFMEYDPYNFPVDNTLAKSASAGAGEATPLPFVCQIRVADDGGVDGGPE